MYFVTQVRKTKVTHPMMKSLQEDIAAGARAFLHTEYIYLTGFCLVSDQRHAPRPTADIG